MSTPTPAQPRRSFWRHPGLLLSLCGMLLILGFLVYDDLDAVAGSHMPWAEDPCGLHDNEQNTLSSRSYLHIANWALVSRASAAPGHEVVLLDITTQTTPPSVTTNSCESRSLLARVINYLNQLGAGAIVIDQYFSPEFCTEDSATAAFIAAVQHSRIPVVLGLGTHALPKATSSGCLALNSPLLIPNAPHLSYGLTRLVNDDLRVPLSWPINKDPSQPVAPIAVSCPYNTVADPKHDCSKPPDSEPSLALAAALAARPQIQNSAKLASAVQGQLYPYTTFDPDVPEENAMDVVCTADPHSPDILGKPIEPACQAWTPINRSRSSIDLRGKTVLIGNVVATDMKPFPTGDKSGLYLHANYIQSILDSRFLIAVPPAITVTGLILFLFAVYLLYWIADCHPWALLSSTAQAGLWSVGAFAVIVLISLVVLLKYSYYTPLWALWGAATIVVVRFLDAFGHHQSQHLFAHLLGSPQPQPVAPQPDPHASRD